MFKSYALGLSCLTCLLLCACSSSYPNIQPQVNSFTIAKHYDRALNILDKDPQGYGEQNDLLYLLDYGMVAHYAGRYTQSIRAFSRAKQLFDEYYTISISNVMSTWLINDTRGVYRGEDFERVMINMFQAMNYMALNNYEEAIVEMRDVDSRLNAINLQYDEDKKNVYKRDAFARLISGILYDWTSTQKDAFEARIDYQKAFSAYREEYSQQYDCKTPYILIENTLANLEATNKDEYQKFRAEFKDVQYKTIKEQSE